MRRAERKERLKRERLVEERYGQSLRQALLPLESESMLPVLVITDMADTRWKNAAQDSDAALKNRRTGSEIAADRGHRRTPGRRPSSESIRLSLVQ